MTEQTEHRVSIRVTPALYAELERIANHWFEGNWSMAARAAFRLLVDATPRTPDPAENEARCVAA